MVETPELGRHPGLKGMHVYALDLAALEESHHLKIAISPKSVTSPSPFLFLWETTTVSSLAKILHPPKEFEIPSTPYLGCPPPPPL